MRGAELAREPARDEPGRGLARAATGAVARLRALAGLVLAPGDAGAARRLAGGAFLMRVVNAGLGFATQILLARWMGAGEYGIYAYVWVWLLVLGGIGSLGLPVAALKFVPDCTHRGDLDGLRGFLSHARTSGLVPSLAAALLAGIALTAAFRFAGSPAAVAPYWAVTLVALATLPIYVLTDIQTGIARAYDFADLGLAADYLVRPLLLLAFAGALALTGGPSGALAVMTATLASVAITALAQGVVLQRRIAARVPAGPARVDRDRWVGVAAPLLAVTGFTLLLGSTDIIVLKLFVGPEEIARYFAATKITAVASFVAYGVAATSSHRFAAHMASGDRAAAARLAAETVRWTFWPTLAVIAALLALSRPLLSLFGAGYAEAWPVLAILSLGLIAQAAVGPADRALSMMEESGVTARIYAAAFAANVALALALTPLFGLSGAALATALALAAKSALLHATARRRLGLDMVVWARSGLAPTQPAEAPPLPLAGRGWGWGAVRIKRRGTGAAPSPLAGEGGLRVSEGRMRGVAPSVEDDPSSVVASRRHLLPQGEKGPRVDAEIVSVNQAALGEAAWRDLAGRALEPNAFYAPAMALAGLRHLAEGRGASVLRVWRKAGEERRLVGLLPLVRARGRVLNPLPIRRAAAIYGTLSTPLLDPDRPDETLAAMLDALAAAGVPGLLLSYRHEDGPVAAALAQATQRAGRAQVTLERHARAMLASRLGGAEYVRATLEPRRRKEADRQRRRLAESGRLALRIAREPAAVAAALESFLALESAGWKGRIGTDLVGAGDAPFMRAAAAGMAERDAFRVAVLELDGRAIAAGLVAVAGRRAFYLKTAYDEAFARFSPGLLLTLDLTAHLLDDPDIDDADSIAVADHPMIDRVWTARFPVAAVLVSTGRPGPLFRAAVLAERLREAARVRSSAYRARFAAWRASFAKDAGTKTAAPGGN